MKRRHTIELNGKKVSYTDNTEFLVQVGKGKKGSYDTMYSFNGELTRAVFYYNSINIGNGFKKRLVMPRRKKNAVLVRAFS